MIASTHLGRQAYVKILHKNRIRALVFCDVARLNEALLEARDLIKDASDAWSLSLWIPAMTT